MAVDLVDYVRHIDQFVPIIHSPHSLLARCHHGWYAGMRHQLPRLTAPCPAHTPLVADEILGFFGHSRHLENRPKQVLCISMHVPSLIELCKQNQSCWAAAEKQVGATTTTSSLDAEHDMYTLGVRFKCT
jgi:hypothetical protein